MLRNGADEVVYPERDIAEKLAIRHNAKNIFDFVEVTDDFAIFEIPILKKWAGKKHKRNRRKKNLSYKRACD